MDFLSGFRGHSHFAPLPGHLFFPSLCWWLRSPFQLLWAVNPWLSDTTGHWSPALADPCPLAKMHQDNAHQWDNALVLVHLHIQGGARAPAWCCPLLPLMTPSCPAPDCNVGTDLSYHSATSGEFPWLLDPSPRELPLPIVSWHFWNYTPNIINDQA